MQDNNKKTIWVPDPQDAYVIKIVEREEATKVICTDGSEYKLSEVNNVNPEKFAITPDLGQLSYLNEASVLDCLKNRLETDQIYTNSGMFLVSMNPYKMMQSMYSEDTMRKIETKRYFDPHIYKTGLNAYESMVESGINQSILITGESGAGKTVNTRKVIDFLSYSSGNETNNASSLLIAANPILEAFGNAKTIKNENSSRFGKFIQIFFHNKMICGGKIDKYLLEVSRVTKVEKEERNYHIFYFLLNASDEIKKELLLEGKKYTDFNILKHGVAQAHGIDDKEEFNVLIKCFNQFKIDYSSFFRIIAAIMHLGNITFSPDGNTVKIDQMDMIEKIADLLKIQPIKLVDAIINPTITVGRETISISRTPEFCLKIVEAIMKNLYDKVFGELVDAINSTFYTSTYDSFIGVLDIAGFEIFENNSFEQLLINYTNERLQQYFNSKMFEEEQKVYKTEGIPWEYIDFGLDLEPCVKAIEGNNPIGILSYLDEECVMPGANDDSVLRKILSIKIANKTGPIVESVPRSNNQFKLKHYAGNVSYTVTEWIEKNKHISNDAVDNLIGCTVVSKKKGVFRTVAQGHREQLKSLMNMLNSTRPHFVRCILPNLKKRPQIVEKHLILDQLKCNGILEGLRISRLGYPTRLSFSEFCNRYNCIVDNSANIKKSDLAISILDTLKGKQYLAETDYKVGHTLIFFKQGVLAELENYRQEFLVKMSVAAQNAIRFKINERVKNLEKIQKESRDQLKKDVQNYLNLRQTNWWKLYLQVKPLLEVRNTQLEEEARAKKLQDLNDTIEKLTETNKYATEDIEKLKNKLSNANKELDDLRKEFEFKLSEAEELNQGLRSVVTNNEETIKKMAIENLNNTNDLQAKVADLLAFKDEVEIVKSQIKSKEKEITKLNSEVEEAKAEAESKQKEIESVKKQLDNERNTTAQSGEETIKKYTSMITEKEDEVATLISKNETMNKKLQATEKSLVEVKDELQRGADDINKLKKEKAEVEEQLNSKNSEIKTIKASVDRIKDDNQEEITTLQSIVDKMRNEAREGEKLTETLHSQINKLKNEVNEQNNTISTQNSDIEHLRNKYNTLNKNMNTMMQERAEEKEPVADAQEVEQLKNTVSLLESQNKKLKNDKENLQNENLELSESKMQDIIKSEGELKIVKKNMQAQINQLKQENASLREELNTSDDEMDAQAILAVKQESLKKINALELHNFELQQRLNSINLDDIRREVDDINDSVNTAVKLFMNDFATILNRKHHADDGYLLEVEKCKASYQEEIEVLRKCYNELFDRTKSGGSDELLKMKSKQLENINKEQEQTITLMSQCMSLLKKKKKGGSNSTCGSLNE